MPVFKPRSADDPFGHHTQPAMSFKTGIKPVKFKGGSMEVLDGFGTGYKLLLSLQGFGIRMKERIV